MKEELIDRLARAISGLLHSFGFGAPRFMESAVDALAEYSIWKKTRGWHLRPEGGWTPDLLPSEQNSFWTIQLENRVRVIAWWNNRTGTWQFGDDIWEPCFVVAYKEPPEAWEG